MFNNRPPPQTFYPMGFAIATLLAPCFWYLTKTGINSAAPPLLRSRSADGVPIKKTTMTKNEKLKLLILHLLRSPQTKSSVNALETLDAALTTIAKDSNTSMDGTPQEQRVPDSVGNEHRRPSVQDRIRKIEQKELKLLDAAGTPPKKRRNNPPNAPHPPNGRPTHQSGDIHQWREELRQLVLLGLVRATHLQSFATVARLLQVYDGIPHQDRSQPSMSSSTSTAMENAQIKKARALLSSRVSTQWKQLHVLMRTCGKKAFGWLLLGGGIGAAAGSMSQLFTYYFGMIQSAAFEGKVFEAWTAALAALSAQLVCQLFEHLGSECVSRGGKTIRRSVQGQLFERLMRADCSYHDHLPSGAKAALLKETSDLESGLFEKPIEICRIIGELIPMYSILTRMSFPLLLVSCVASPFLGWVSSRAALRTASVHRAIVRLDTSRNITDQMVLGSHLKTVRANTDEDHEIARYRAYLSHHATLERELLKAQTWSQGARYMKQMGTVSVLVLIADMVRGGALKSNEFSGYFLQIEIAWRTLETLYQNCGTFWQSFEPAGRVLAALSLKGEGEGEVGGKGEGKRDGGVRKSVATHKEGVNGQEHTQMIAQRESTNSEESQTNGSSLLASATTNGLGITFENVWFSYPLRANNPVLKGVSFTIRPGSYTAIVGPSGSGKSTVMALLERFYAPSKGSICINGTNIQHCHVQQHRRRISYVSQDTCIFPRTVRENIIMGGRHHHDSPGKDWGNNDDGVCNSDIIEALKQANAWEFCKELPDGLFTWIVSGGAGGGGGGSDMSSSNYSGGLKGNTLNNAESTREEAEAGTDTMGLSGGQSARIGIARAIMRKAPILLLDEAFSNLDAKSERIILLELSKILQSTTSKTVVAISHQLESLSWVDQILVLKDGRVREVGTFDELSKKNGVFQSMLRQKKTT